MHATQAGTARNSHFANFTKEITGSPGIAANRLKTGFQQIFEHGESNKTGIQDQGSNHIDKNPTGERRTDGDIPGPE